MRRLLCLTAAMCAVAHCARSAETVRMVSLPDLSNFPQLYVGVPLVLDQVELDWKIVKEFGYYCVGLAVKEGERSNRAIERGEYIPPFLNKQRITIVADEKLAQDLLDRIELDTVYPVKVWCTVGRAEDLAREMGNSYWVARVTRVDCYGADRSVAWTLPIPEQLRASAAAETAPAKEASVLTMPLAPEAAQPATTAPVE